MICHWCNGTRNECGCGFGYCAHCDGGKVADPPFGPLNYLEGSEFDILTDENFKNLSGNSIHEMIRNVSFVLFGCQVLTEEEVRAAIDYWDNPYRDENLGEVLNRVAWFAKSKNNKNFI